MRYFRQKMTARLLSVLFTVTATLAVAVTWAATAGTLNIGGQANLTDDTVKFVAAATADTGTGQITGMSGNTLNFAVDLAGVGDTQTIKFQLENTSATKNASVQGIGFSAPDTTGLGSTAAYWTADAVSFSVSGSFGALFTLNAGSKTGDITVTVKWEDKTNSGNLLGFITVTVQFQWMYT